MVESTYLHLLDATVIGLVFDRIVEIVSVEFALSIEMIKCVEEVECEGGVWTKNCSRKPSQMQ